MPTATDIHVKFTASSLRPSAGSLTTRKYPNNKADFLTTIDHINIDDVSIHRLSASQWKGEHLIKCRVLVAETFFWEDNEELEMKAFQMVQQNKGLVDALGFPDHGLLQPAHIQRKNLAKKTADFASTFYAHLRDVLSPQDLDPTSTFGPVPSVRVRTLRATARKNYHESALETAPVETTSDNASIPDNGRDASSAIEASDSSPDSISILVKRRRAAGQPSDRFEEAFSQIDELSAVLDEAKTGGHSDTLHDIRTALSALADSGSLYTPSVNLADSGENTSDKGISMDELLTTVTGHWFTRMILQSFNVKLGTQDKSGQYPAYLDANISQTRYIVPTTHGTFEARTDGAVEIRTYDVHKRPTPEVTPISRVLTDMECKRNEKVSFLPQHFSQLMAGMASRLQVFQDEASVSAYEKLTISRRTVHLLCYNRHTFRVVWANFDTDWLNWMFGPWGGELAIASGKKATELKRAANPPKPRSEGAFGPRNIFQSARISRHYSLASQRDRLEIAKIIVYVTCMRNDVLPVVFNYDVWRGD
ncbi:hypothetical protein DXG01_002795 [Tephrocybe rancida]|nr:hypothetical protein DXG01_002795 [Tephrocybe rancida]